MLIAFCGKAGAGKSEASNILCENFMAHPVAFADPLRLMVAPVAFMVNNGDQDAANHALYEGKDNEMPLVGTSARQLYRDFGDAMRSHDINVFIKLTELKIKMCRSFYQRKLSDEHYNVPIVIDDLRQANEADWVKEQGGTIIQINRPQEHLRKVPHHATENGINPLMVDFEIDNTGSLFEFKERIMAIGELYGLEKALPPEMKRDGSETLYVH